MAIWVNNSETTIQNTGVEQSHKWTADGVRQGSHYQNGSYKQGDKTRVTQMVIYLS